MEMAFCEEKDQGAPERCLETIIDGQHKKLLLDDIMYVEAVGSHVSIHTTRKSYEVKQRFSTMAKELKEDGFVSAHRSYCVNLKYAQQLTKTECLLDDGSSIPVSRSSYKKINDAFIGYYCSRETCRQS